MKAVSAPYRASFVVFAFVLASCGADVTESLSSSIGDGEGSSTSATTFTSGPDDGGSEGVGSEGVGSEGAGSESVGPTTDGGETTAATEGGESDGTEGTTTEPASTTGGSTGEPTDCPSLDEDECDDENDCMAIAGSPYVHLMGMNWCVDDEAFLGCVAAMDCDQGKVYGCDGDDTWQFGTSCLPEGWVVCDPPDDNPANCDSGEE
jgi:hypothetical protein